MHNHFWPDIDEVLNALYPERGQSWSESHTSHFFSINDSSGLFLGQNQTLRATQPAAIKWQSSFLSTDNFDCCCCGLTYYLILVRDTSTIHAYDFNVRYKCVQNFSTLGAYLWVRKGWVFVGRFIVAEGLRYMLLITSALTPHKTGNMSLKTIYIPTVCSNNYYRIKLIHYIIFFHDRCNMQIGI